MEKFSLNTLEITNKCVVLCDLRDWSDSESNAWQVYIGSRDDIGQRIAVVLEAAQIERIDDFGGVSKTILCDGDRYKEFPAAIKGSAAVFSFTPKNRIGNEGQQMARVSKLAGYKLLILTVQKDDKYGKVWVLGGVLHHWLGAPLVYFEDTGSVIDELKSSPEAEKVVAVHVLVPGYEAEMAKLSDRAVSQAEYQDEVLE